MVGAASGILERDAELRAIAARLDRACAGDGSLTVVEGPAGIGKTTLLRAAADLAAERGMRVLRARGGILEQELEYGVVRQLVERPVLTATPERQAALLAGPAAPAAAVLGLAPPPTDAGPGHDPSGDIVHALQWLVANLADDGPLLLLLDDAHWGDAASLRAGGYLARRLDGLAVAVLVGTRSDEPGSQQRLLAELFAAADPFFLRPQPLTTDGVAALLGRAFAGQAAPASLVDACDHATGGNPFLLVELAAELAEAHPSPDLVAAGTVAEAGPLAVRRSLLLRLGHLGEPALLLARAVATLGGEGELRHAAAISGLPLDVAGAAADALTAAGLLEPRRPLRMVHPLVRAAVDGDCLPSDREAAHRRAYEVLRDEGAGDDALVPHAIAAAATGDGALVGLLRRTAERALRTGAADVAAVQLRRALVEPPPADQRAALLAELGRAEVRQGAFADGIARLDLALELLEAPARRAAVHRDRAFAAFAGQGMDAARELVRGAVAEQPPDGADDALQLEADLALLAWLSGQEHALDLGRHRGLPGETRAERTILALLAQERHAVGAPADEVVALAVRALAGGRLVAEDSAEALHWYMATYALLTCEAHREARETIEQALADGRRRGSAFATAGALGTRAVLALNEGRPRDAEADARAAAGGAIPPVMAGVNASYVVLALVDQGDLAGAAAHLAASGLEHHPSGPTVMRWIAWAKARLHEAEGRPDAVAADLVPLEEDDRAGRPMRALAWRALAARTLARGGDDGERERARALADEHLAWARSWERPCALGVAERAAALAGPADDRIAGLERAVATLAGSGLRTEEARARGDHGVALLRAGRRRDGRAALEQALEVALGCGARGTAEAVAAELEVAGAPPKRLRFDELTASERRIAELAAGGRTNREIAEELFVTPKTVENHLTRVYAKLGVPSRRALADAL
ncbi:AAA family ATPase [Patulibacter defluvii]|uniref:AAA family ATPase n=1 Tax=Patulibacter defluvii TaxID=3095358 RepID=UPI002A756A70|nr:AAA family ATPase [Patulibacter sp. DM4]